MNFLKVGFNSIVSFTALLLISMVFSGRVKAQTPTPTPAPSSTPVQTASPAPAANPGDVATMDSIVAALYDVISGRRTTELGSIPFVVCAGRAFDSDWPPAYR
jgi:hypothetical protein